MHKPAQIKIATEPGSSDKDSEDWAYADDDLIVVLDGATTRTDTGCIHGVPWYVRQLGAAIVRNSSDHTASLTDAVAAAITDVLRLHPQCDLTHPGSPSAAVGVVRITAVELVYLVLGDVSLVMMSPQDVKVVSDSRVSGTAAAERAEADRHPIGSPAKAAALLAMKHIELAERNREGGYWIAETDPKAVEHALTGAVPLDRISQFAVLTDGAARAVEFDLYDWPQAFATMAKGGPSALIRSVRAAENTDLYGIRWPRNKISDDATIVFAGEATANVGRASA